MSTALVPLKPTKPLPAFGGLTLKQSAFVDHYLLTGNATESALKAGYNGDKNTLGVIGSQLIRSLKVKQEINRRLGNSVASSLEVLERLTQHARGDLTDVLDENGELNLKLARKRGTSKLLKRVKVKTRYEKDADGDLHPVTEREYEIHDPQAALEKLGRFHKLFTDKVEVEQPQINGIEEALKEVKLAVAAIVRSEQLSQYDAALKLAEQLADVPELANQLRAWAESDLRQREST